MNQVVRIHCILVFTLYPAIGMCQCSRAIRLSDRIRSINQSINQSSRQAGRQAGRQALYSDNIQVFCDMVRGIRGIRGI